MQRFRRPQIRSSMAPKVERPEDCSKNQVEHLPAGRLLDNAQSEKKNKPAQRAGEKEIRTHGHTPAKNKTLVRAPAHYTDSTRWEESNKNATNWSPLVYGRLFYFGGKRFSYFSYSSFGFLSEECLIKSLENWPKNVTAISRKWLNGFGHFRLHSIPLSFR